MIVLCSPLLPVSVMAYFAELIVAEVVNKTKIRRFSRLRLMERYCHGVCRLLPIWQVLWLEQFSSYARVVLPAQNFSVCTSTQ